MIFHSHANKTHCHKKGCALGLVSKVGVFGTWKWPIDIRGQLYLYVKNTQILMNPLIHHRPRAGDGEFSQRLAYFHMKRSWCFWENTLSHVDYSVLLYLKKLNTFVEDLESSHNLIKCTFFHLVLLAQCALFAEISTHQEERQSTLKYS